MTDTPCAIGGDKHPLADPVVCPTCRLRFATDLDWIHRNHETLAEHLAPRQATGGTHTIPASKPPLRTDVLSMEAKGGVSAILGSWVQLLVEDRNVTPPNYRLGQTALVAEQIQRLTAHSGWLLDQEFAPELVEEIATLRNDITRLLGLSERQWLPLPGRWDCPVIDPDVGPCGTRLRQKVGEWLVVCRTCGTRWEGDAELERLGALLGCETEVTIDQAASLLRVSRRTLYRLMGRSGINPVTRDGRATVDKLDLVRINTG